MPATGWIAFTLAACVASAEALASTGDKALGEYLSSECATCHQTSGKQIGGIPAIVGHPAEQFVALMNTYKDRNRENQVMQAIAARLSEEEISALAAFYESIRPAQ